MSNSSLLIDTYSIQLCGMFNFTPNQRAQLVNGTFYKKKVIDDPKIHGIIAKQYYPVFRPFILNDCPAKEYLELVSANNIVFTCCQFSDYSNYGQSEPSPYFNIQNISLSFYNERFKTGIYSFEIRIVDEHGTELQVTPDAYSSMVKFAREFDNQIVLAGQTMSISSFIEQKLLALNSSGKFISISEQADSVYHNGSKLKAWMTADFQNYAVGYSAEHALFELGTSSPHRSSVRPGPFRPSKDYFDMIMKDKISVFDNWTALCLFDSFTLLGENYLREGEMVWRDTYLKIYKFNLYCKFYLFKVNSDITVKGRISVTRKELLGFMNKYSLEMISYNFLPNLIFANIKDKLGIQIEMTALMEKIENSRKIYQETSERSLNAVLSIIALTSLVSVIGDFSGVVAKIYGVSEASITDQQHNTWIALGIILAIILFIILRYFYRRLKL